MPMTASPPSAEIGDGRGGEGCGRHLPESGSWPRDKNSVRHTRLGRVSLQDWRDVQGAQHASHAHPQRARQREVGEQLLGEVFVAAGPEVLVVAQRGVIGGEPVGESRGDSPWSL